MAVYDTTNVKILPKFNNYDESMRKQQRGAFTEIEEDAKIMLHEEVPGNITVFSCTINPAIADHLDWVYIKNGSANVITLVCRFTLWDADCHINIDPDGFLLLKDISLDNLIPHIDDGSTTIFTWPGDIAEDLDDFIHIMPGETCWTQLLEEV